MLPIECSYTEHHISIIWYILIHVLEAGRQTVLASYVYLHWLKKQKQIISPNPAPYSQQMFFYISWVRIGLHGDLWSETRKILWQTIFFFFFLVFPFQFLWTWDPYCSSTLRKWNSIRNSRLIPGQCYPLCSPSYPPPTEAVHAYPTTAQLLHSVDSLDGQLSIDLAELTFKASALCQVQSQSTETPSPLNQAGKLGSHTSFGIQFNLAEFALMFLGVYPMQGKTSTNVFMNEWMNEWKYLPGGCGFEWEDYAKPKIPRE